MQGGKFQDGFLYAGLGKSADIYYKETVGFKANPLPGDEIPGGIYKTRDANGYFIVPEGKDVFGLNEARNGDFWHDMFIQGGSVGKIGNATPIGNAIAGLHDSWFNQDMLPYNKFTNIASMPVASVVTYGAVISGPLSVQLAVDRSRK